MALEQANLYKDKNNVILINGEIGTGKATLARAMHRGSKRRNKPFVTLHSNTLKSKLNIEKAFDYIQKKAYKGTVYIVIQQPIPPFIQTQLLDLMNECKTTRFIFGNVSNLEEHELP